MRMEGLTRGERWAFILFFAGAALAFFAWAFPNMSRVFTIPGAILCLLAAAYFAWPDIKRLYRWTLAIFRRENIPVIAGVAVVLAIGLGCVIFSRPHQPAKSTTSGAQSSPVVTSVVPQSMPASSPSQMNSPVAAPTPDHPPIAKFQKFTLTPGQHHLSFSVDTNSVSDQNKQFLTPEPNQANIAKSHGDDEPNMLSLFVRDSNNVGGTIASVDVIMNMNDPNSMNHSWIHYVVFYNLETYAKFMSIYFDEPLASNYIMDILANEYEHLLYEVDSKLGVSAKPNGQIGEVNSWDMKFSGQMTIYADIDFNLDDVEKWRTKFRKNGLSVQFRGAEYASLAWQNIKQGIATPIDLYYLKGTPPVITPMTKKR